MSQSTPSQSPVAAGAAASAAAGPCDPCTQTPDVEELVRRLAAETAARAEAEAALLRTEQRFRLALDNSPITVASCDTDLRYTWICNPPPVLAQQDCIGRRLEEIAGAPADVAELVALKRQVLDTGVVVRREIDLVLDGQQRRYDVTAEPVWEDGCIAGVTSAVMDVTAQRAAETAARESEYRFRALFEQSAVGAGQVSPEGHWLQVNQRLCEITGYSEAELRQRRFQDLTHPDDLTEDLELVRRLWAEEIPSYSITKRYVRRSGDTIWVHVTRAVIRDRDGKPAGFVSVVEDITEARRASEALLARERELREAQEKLIRSYEEARRALRVRDEVVAIVSHDLRNPLNTIRMAAELFSIPSVPADRKLEHTSILRRCVDQMDRLISDLLDVSRIENGPIPLQIGPVDLALALEDALAALRADAAERHVTLDLRRAGTAPLLGDQQRLAQLFGNILGNAVRYTPRGGTITVTTRDLPGEVAIDITDDGPGIPPEDLPHLFDRFWQARRTGRAGAGLGLAIARAIAEAHGGVLSVTSQVGVGTTFTLVLPTPAATDRPT